ncbi:MAG: SpoIIE family protein phosphatase [Acidobacteriota bacterium]|nr:SpoIIE family protein phosphatase [Acidobacteriota bacterium]
MDASVRIPIDHTSQCFGARRAALDMAGKLGFSEVCAGRVGIVITEVCTNILKHAGRGEVLLRAGDTDGAHASLELLALDKGPGMENVEKCLADGYSTGSSGQGGGMGQGLGAIQRLSDESDFYSVPGEGAAVLARWNPEPAKTAPARYGADSVLTVGAVNVCKHGEEVCGDSWGIEERDGVYTILVADGLGHGPEARQASLAAVHILRGNSDKPPAMLIDLAHKALRSLRGAAVSVVRLDPAAGRLSFSGLGNVAAQIYLGTDRSQHLVSVNGTAGHHAASIREFAYTWPSNGILIVHSDGLATGARLNANFGLAQHDPALIAGVLYRDFARGHDDATVVVAKAA